MRDITLYCVFRGGYEDYDLDAIFSTEEKAKEWVAKNKNHELELSKTQYIPYCERIDDNIGVMILDAEPVKMAEGYVINKI